MSRSQTATVDATIAGTVALAERFARLEWADTPTAVRERTKEVTLDFLGVALRGSLEPSSAPVISFVTDMGAGSATVLGVGLKSAPAWAALANGTSAHALEMDDVTRESSLHPGVAVIPAALATAEDVHADAVCFLNGVVAGYEVMLRVGNALNPASAYARGFHPTGVAGVFGAAAAAARVLSLSPDQFARALGIAGTIAAGSLEYLSDGSWSKRLNPGWAAHSGVVAAALAQRGFTGPLTAIEGPHGLLRGYSDEPYVERLTENLHEAFLLLSVSMKPYACCRYNHGLIDAVLSLRRDRRLRADEVQSMRLGVLDAGWSLVADPIDRKRDPRNVVDAQFSAPFAAAVALLRGSAGLDQYTQANIDDPMIKSLMSRIECFRDAGLDAKFPKLWPAAVEVLRTDGSRISARLDHAYGDPESPVSRADQLAKFVAFSDRAFDGRGAHAFALRVLGLEHEDLLSLLSELREARRSSSPA